MSLKRPARKIKWTNQITPAQIQGLIRSEPDTIKAVEIFDSAQSNGYKHDISTFSLLISRLAGANLFSAAESLLSRIQPETQQPVPESAFLPLIRAYGKAHRPIDSLRIFQAMKYQYNVVPTHKSYNATLAVLVSDNKLKLAKQIHEEMQNDGIMATVATYNVLIKALCMNEKGLDKAVKVFRKMERRDACSYNTLIDGLCKYARIDDARKLFEEMGEENLEVGVVSFTSLIHGLSKNGFLDDALELFDEMRKKKVNANLVTYSSLLDGLSKGGMAGKAVKLLDNMVLDKCTPNTISYSSIINGLCKEGRIFEASEILDRMRLQGKKPDAGLYGKVITGFCELGKVNEAANFLDEMVISGVLPNRVTWSLHLKIHNMVVRGLCVKNELSRGFRIYQSMRTRGISVEEESFVVLVGCYCKKRDVHKAVKIVEEMLIDGCVPNEKMLSEVMSGYLGRKKAKEAVELMWNDLVGEGL